MCDDDVEFVIIHKGRGWAAIDVEFVNKPEFRPPPNPIQSACTVSPVKPTDIPRSLMGNPNYTSVSGNNNPFVSQVSPGFTSACNDQVTPASTTKHAVMGDNDSFESIDTSRRSDSLKASDTEDGSGGDVDGEQAKIVFGTEKRGMTITPNSSSPSLNTWWTVPGSELYSNKVVGSVDLFDNSSNQGPLYKGQMFKDKPTLKQVVGSYAFGKRPIICIDATHLKARIRGVLLVAVCKDINEMIYPLAFGFANSECPESWTWFLKKHCKLIQYLDRVMLVSDQHNGIFNAIEAIFPDAAHGIYAYHLAQNLKRFFKQRDDIISLYYRAMYAYCIDDFDRLMAELKETYRKVYNELQGVGIKKFSLSRYPRKRFKGVSINSLVFDLYTTGFLKHAYEFWDISDAIRNRIVLSWEKKSTGKIKEVEDTVCWGEKKVTFLFKVWKKKDTRKQLARNHHLA
ncbi:hypothetical protein Ddye_017801 [Dipteronia dyeriana]|uniref:MULE transposase domain-containing protein n=1 Tax=Dipteronia dyeriana TaxID=168575 RepID=A0AAD9X1G5_9ROSI|nr:hypothetical protein Ddye_017801 [Dipteronia dyeriana]